MRWREIPSILWEPWVFTIKHVPEESRVSPTVSSQGRAQAGFWWMKSRLEHPSFLGGRERLRGGRQEGKGWTPMPGLWLRLTQLWLTDPGDLAALRSSAWGPFSNRTHCVHFQNIRDTGGSNRTRNFFLKWKLSKAPIYCKKGNGVDRRIMEEMNQFGV
jgi:hypothetical protein